LIAASNRSLFFYLFCAVTALRCTFIVPLYTFIADPAIKIPDQICLFLVHKEHILCMPIGHWCDKMKSFSALILAMLLLITLASLAFPGVALESVFYTVTEKTLSVDLDPSFEIGQGDLNASDRGMVTQDFFINTTTVSNAAFISIMSVYDDVLKRLSPENLSKIFEASAVLAVEDKGDGETGNWTATSSLGGEVTVHSISSADPSISPERRSYDMAIWSLGGQNYALVVSLLDRNNTSRMIETMTLI